MSFPSQQQGLLTTEHHFLVLIGVGLQISKSLHLVDLYMLNLYQGCAKHSSSITSWNYQINPRGKYYCHHHHKGMEAQASETVIKQLPQGH